MTRKVIFVVIFWKALLLGIVYWAQFIIPLNTLYIPERLLRQMIPCIFWVWGNFDGVHYVSIARSGYFYGQQPFFPLYPYLIRLVYEVFYFQIPYLVVGQLISVGAFIGALVILYKLLALDRKTSLWRLIVLTILVYPTSFFYTAIYNDALFFLLAMLTIFSARGQQWVMASIWAGLATLTRLNGLALFFVILAEFIVGKRLDTKSQWNSTWLILRLKTSLTWQSIKKSRIYTIFLIPSVFIGYLLWVHRFFGTWQLVFSSMKNWNQDKIIFPLQVVWRYIKILFVYPTPTIPYAVALVEFLSVLLYSFLLVYAFKKIRISYWMFFFVSILIPALTGTFQGMPRYGLHLYPFFLLLGLVLEKSSFLVRLIYFVVSVSILVFMLSLFSRGFFVS